MRNYTSGQPYHLGPNPTIDEVLSHLPPLPDNVTVVVRRLQEQITALEARIEVLEP